MVVRHGGIAGRAVNLVVDRNPEHCQGLASPLGLERPAISSSAEDRKVPALAFGRERTPALC
jgi:hypothetical protein